MDKGAARLQRLWVASAKSTVAATAASRASTVPANPSVYTGLEQSLAVECPDSPDPRNVSAYASDVKLANARSGGLGLAWLWGDEPCAQWPGNGARDRYKGPWNRRTAHTILLLGITGDAVLPYDGDLAMEHDLARARACSPSADTGTPR
jgi:hypothetical protein